MQYGCNCLGPMNDGCRCPKCWAVREQWDTFENSGCHEAPLHFWPLGDAYHAIWTKSEVGFDYRLPQGLRLAWWLLLEHDAGVRPAERVELPVPGNANELVRETAGFAALMFALHGAIDPRPMPFSVTLVSDRLRVPRPRAGEAIQALRKSGGLIQAGSTKGVGRRTPLYRPGTM